MPDDDRGHWATRDKEICTSRLVVTANCPVDNKGLVDCRAGLVV